MDLAGDSGPDCTDGRIGRTTSRTGRAGTIGRYTASSARNSAGWRIASAVALSASPA